MKINYRIHLVKGIKPLSTREVWQPVYSNEISTNDVYASKEFTIEALKRALKYVINRKF